MPTPDEARRALGALSSAAEADARRMVAATQLIDDLMVGVPDVIDYYSTGTAALAADHYDDLRDAARARGRFTAEPVARLREEKVRRATLWATEPLKVADLTDMDIELAANRLGEVVQYETAQPFRETILTNRQNDPAAVGWRRHTSMDSCKFCRLLAERGAVYRESSARFASHPRCHCTAAPVFDGEVGEEADVLQYEASKRRTSPGTRARLNERLRNMPDAPPAAVRSGIPVSPRIGNRPSGFIEQGLSFDPDLSASKATTMQKRWNLPREDGAVQVRVGGEDALRGILDDGRFKTMHDFGDRVGGGASNKQERMAVERAMFGATDTQPVYGYVNPSVFGASNGENAVWQYGNVRVGLRADVLDRTSVTFGDSLVAANPPAPVAINEVATAAPSRLADAWAADYYTPARFAKGERYIEAQFHGGLTVDDIAFVQGDLSPEIVQRLVERGIQVLGPA